jgi:hypothetical protein
MSTATPTKEDSSSKVVKNHPLICLKRHFMKSKKQDREREEREAAEWEARRAAAR